MTWGDPFQHGTKMRTTCSVCYDVVQVNRQQLHASGHKGGERYSRCNNLLLTYTPHKCEPKEFIFTEVNGKIEKTFGRPKFREYAIPLHRTGEDSIWIGAAGQITAKQCAEYQHTKSL